MDYRRLLHPEYLSYHDLRDVLENLCINIPNGMTKSEITEVYKRVALPLPQRTHVKRSLWTLKEENKHICAGLIESLERTNLQNGSVQKGNEADSATESGSKRVKLNRFHFTQNSRTCRSKDLSGITNNVSQSVNVSDKIPVSSSIDNLEKTEYIPLSKLKLEEKDEVNTSIYDSYNEETSRKTIKISPESHSKRVVLKRTHLLKNLESNPKKIRTADV